MEKVEVVIEVPRSKSVKDFIASEAEKLMSYNLKEFYDTIHSKFYPRIEDDFKDYFFELCEKDEDEFCVEQEKLKEYGVLTCLKTSNDIKRSLDRLKLAEGVEYSLLRQLAQQSETSRGIKYKNIYSLTPQAFKLALIRSHNENKYAKYYLLLEKVFFSYQEYQVLYKEKLLAGKDEKLDRVIKQNEEQTKIINEQTTRIEKLLGFAEDTNKTVHKMEKTIDSLIKLIGKFISLQIDTMYTFSNQIKNTKVLIVYVLKNKNKHVLAIRYCQLCDITKSIKNLTSKDKYKDFKVANFFVLGALMENIITIQSLYNEIDSINKLEKTMIDVNQVDIDDRINQFKEHLKNNKNKIFTENIQRDEHLKDQENAINEVRKVDDEFNSGVNGIVDKFLKEKLFHGKNLKQLKMCEEIKELLAQYKN